MINYIFYLHIGCAFLSFGLLLIRGVMQLSNQNWRAIKLLKILPHLSDTLLLLSGISMLFIVGYGFPIWMIGKILFLISYIIFSAKFFSRKVQQPKTIHFYMAVISFAITMLLVHFH